MGEEKKNKKKKSEKTNEKAQKSKKVKIDVDGKTWLRYSISVWDIVKTTEERKLGHPAMFPLELCDRIIQIFSRAGDTVLDPFAGSGSTLISAANNGRSAVGFEINKEYIQLIKKRKRITRLDTFSKSDETDSHIFKIIHKDAHQISEELDEDSVDLVLTSPPYWNILRMKRTADYKEIRPYSEGDKDLGNIEDYQSFLDEFKDIFIQVYSVLKAGQFCIIVLMDIRKKNKLYTFHIDTIKFMNEIGFTLDDIIIWNRQQEYNNLRPLGYPYVFRVNRIHEYILIFQKRV